MEPLSAPFIRSTVYAAAVISFLTFGACASDGGSTEERIADDGVPIVLSRATAPFPEPWRFTQELIAGIAYGDTAYMLRNPHHVLVLENGTWVVLDSQPLEFRIYTADGRYLRSFGREGRGPTDLRWSYPTSRLIAVGADRFEYWCDWPLWIQTWNLAGELLAIRSMAPDHPLLQSGRPRRLSTIGDRLYTLVSSWRRNEADETIHFSHLVTSDWAGSFLDTLFTLENAPMSLGASSAQAAFDYPPVDELLTTTAGRLYLSPWDSDWITELDPRSGQAIRRFRLEHEPMTIPEYWVGRYREMFGHDIADGLIWLRERSWFVSLSEGPRNEIWVQRRGEPLADGTWPVDVFSADGHYRGRMSLTDQFPFGDNWNDLELLTLGSTEEGAPALVRYTFHPNRE